MQKCRHFWGKKNSPKTVIWVSLAPSHAVDTGNHPTTRTQKHQVTAREARHWWLFRERKPVSLRITLCVLTFWLHKGNLQTYMSWFRKSWSSSSAYRVPSSAYGSTFKFINKPTDLLRQLNKNLWWISASSSRLAEQYNRKEQFISTRTRLN